METERTLLVITGHSRGLGAALTAWGLAKGLRVLGLSRGHLVQTHPHLEQISIDLAQPQALEGVLDGLALGGSLTGFQRIWLISITRAYWAPSTGWEVRPRLRSPRPSR